MPTRVPSAKRPVVQQQPALIVSAIEDFLAKNVEAAVLEDGKVLFDLRTAKYTLSTEYDRCTLHLWSEEANLVCRVVSFEEKSGVLRLSTMRFGQAKPKLLELAGSSLRRTPTTRDARRTHYMRLLERALAKQFPEWRPEAFRTAMDLERSFGPAYARGSLVRGNHAWAVIGVGAHESVATIEGVLTLGILWLHHCREQAGGRKLYQGLRIVSPRGQSMLTLSRLAWMDHDAARWELYELDEASEELTQRDADDTGNLRTRLIHHPDEQSAGERFADASARVMALVPSGDHGRVEQRLRSSTEIAFLLHGLEFARARMRPSASSFSRQVEISVGAGANETLLTESNREQLAELVDDLFRRRRSFVPQIDFAKRGDAPSRRIGANTSMAAHSRLQADGEGSEAAGNPVRDPLYRASPERWLESVLRRDLAPLTRGLAPEKQGRPAFVRDEDDDLRGNRVDTAVDAPVSRVIPRLDPQHVYTQVPAIAGASDRGLLDLLGVTSDGRLAVIELKTDDDLHFALQGLDYWVRVRHHHLQTDDPASGLGEFQRYGYFRGVELSRLPPRLYLVAPSLHIHPATETVLRYLSPRVEWNLLALDERWRREIRVVWRKDAGNSS